VSDEQILERLVTLNHERAEEEKRGQTRWLRPDFQCRALREHVQTEMLPDDEAPADAKNRKSQIANPPGPKPSPSKSKPCGKPSNPPPPH
jgi:hypothetical protein